MLKRISYPLTSRPPLYPGTPEIACTEGKSIGKGDGANTTIVTLSTHSGTHVDAPRHFCPGGKTTREMLSDHLTLFPVYCLDLPAEPKAAIRIPDLEPRVRDIPDARGIFLRTGMYRIRASNPGRYCRDHPWIHPEIPAFLRSACPALGLFGTDTISISSPAFRTEGRTCHKAFLCDRDPLLLAEDLDLSDPELTKGPFTVTIYPWLVEDLDGVPVFAFAELP